MDSWVAISCAAMGVLGAPAVPRVAQWASGAAVGRGSTAWIALLAGGLLGVLGGSIGLTAALPAYLVFGWVAIVLFVVDLGLHRLPDRLTLPSYGAGVLLLGLAAVIDNAASDLVRALLGGGVVFAIYLVLHMIGGPGLGAGDVKYAGVLGMHLAWFGWPTVIIGILAGFVVAGVVSLAMLTARRATLKTHLPFGPSMIIGAVLAIVVAGGIAQTGSG